MSARGIAALLVAIVATAVRAADAPVPPATLELGAGIASLPDFPGSRTASARGRVWLDATLRTERLGTYSIDSGSLTLAPALRWSPFDPDAAAGASLLLGERTGRNHRRPGFASTNDGSDRLAGLPDVASSPDVGIEGHVRPFGVPLFAVARHAVGGAQGTTVDAGVYAPLRWPGVGELTILPTVRWNDGREARAWFGVDPGPAAVTGRAAYRPRAGLQRAALELAIDAPVSARWHVVGSLAAVRLLGDAAHGPIVERRAQAIALLGVVWHP